MSKIHFYKTYKWGAGVDQDPIVDELHSAFEDAGISLAKIADRSGVCLTTLNNWFDGKTKRPQYATVRAVARAIGYDVGLIKMSAASSKGAHLRLVKMAKRA